MINYFFGSPTQIYLPPNGGPIGPGAGPIGPPIDGPPRPRKIRGPRP
jgi:hypothetical protein